MAKALDMEFDTWLSEKLTEMNTDDTIFSPYIKGILDADETEDEKKEAIQGLLTDIMESGIEEFCTQILQKWNLLCNTKTEIEEQESKFAADEKIVRIMEVQKQNALAQNSAVRTNEEQKKLKQAILAQYGEVSEEETMGSRAEVDDQFRKNPNIERVTKEEKERRVKEKEAAQKKKEKDKEDRAKQKVKEEERKDREKKRTQKGERRR